MKFDYEKLLEEVKNKKIISRSIVLIFSVFLMALNYNLFLLPNNLVAGGTSGLAIVLKSVFGLDPQLFIYITSVVLILISYIFLGISNTNRSIVGALLYPVFISITTPIAEFLLPYLNFDSFLIVVLIASLLSGLSNGLVYKTGFTTGGSDIIMQILNKYLHIPTGKSNFVTNGVIIGIGGIVFGVNKVVYAIIYLYISSTLIDKILIGISDSKMFFIHSKKPDEIREFVIHEFNTGATIFEAEGGYSKSKNKMVMCVVPTSDYYHFKEMVLAIDPSAFFVISDCYEVSGGVKRTKLPFM